MELYDIGLTHPPAPLSTIPVGETEGLYGVIVMPFKCGGGDELDPGPPKPGVVAGVLPSSKETLYGRPSDSVRLPERSGRMTPPVCC